MDICKCEDTDHANIISRTDPWATWYLWAPRW